MAEMEKGLATESSMNFQCYHIVSISSNICEQVGALVVLKYDIRALQDDKCITGYISDFLYKAEWLKLQFTLW